MAGTAPCFKLRITGEYELFTVAEVHQTIIQMVEQNSSGQEFYRFLDSAFSYYPIGEIVKFPLDFPQYGQEKLNLVFKLVLENRFKRATHLIGTIPHSGSLGLTDEILGIVDYYVDGKGYVINLDDEGILDDDPRLSYNSVVSMIETLSETNLLVDSNIFRPLYQHLLNMSLVSRGVDLDKAVEVCNYLEQYDLKFGFYHQFYFLHMKDQRLSRYVLLKASDNYLQRFTDANNFNGPLIDCSVFCQKLLDPRSDRRIVDRWIGQDLANTLLLDDDHEVFFKLSVFDIASLSFDCVMKALLSLFSKFPSLTGIYRNQPYYQRSLSTSVTSSINQDIEFLLSSDQAELALEVANNSILLIEPSTMIALFAYLPVDICNDLYLYKGNMALGIAACIYSQREEVIDSIMEEHRTELFKKFGAYSTLVCDTVLSLSSNNSPFASNFRYILEIMNAVLNYNGKTDPEEYIIENRLA